MPFVDRNQSGEIVGRFASRQRPGQEYVEAGSTELLALRTRESRRERIAELEAGQSRAVREAILTGDKMALQAIDDQIAQLRAAQ